MGGALRRPTKFDCGAPLQQSSNIFYQKFVEINRPASAATARKRGLRGKGIAAAASAFARSASRGSLPAKFFAPLENRKEGKGKQCHCPQPARAATHAPKILLFGLPNNIHFLNLIIRMVRKLLCGIKLKGFSYLGNPFVHCFFKFSTSSVCSDRFIVGDSN